MNKVHSKPQVAITKSILQLVYIALTLSCVKTLIVLDPQFCIRVRGMTSNALPTAL